MKNILFLQRNFFIFIFLLPLLIILQIFMGIEGAMYSAPVADGIAAVLSAWFIWKELKTIDKKLPN